MSQIIQAIRGMNDILPDEAELWEWFDESVRDWLRSYGYRPIRMPLLEPTPLFTRAIGAVTDIVEKEMYSFTDSLNGEQLTLRPEGTAGCVRAALQHNLLYDGPKRLWYQGPMFRHERPQKGRYRQFHQVGVEALGFEGPDIDAELILMCQRLWDDLGLEGIHLELNSLGQIEERQQHRGALIAHFENHASRLDADAQRRLHTNPLRILDSKNPEMRDLIENAPKLLDYLGADSLRHFEALQALLKENGIPYRINPRLVRGLDYYNLTVFEWITDSLGAQGTVCAGGRYDGLFAQLGGKSQPACGFAMGIERLLMLLREKHGKLKAQAPDIYVVHKGSQAQRFAFVVAEGMRDNGFTVQLYCGGGSFKSQMKRADASGALLALIIGEDEAAAREVSFKPLREAVEQRRVAYDQLAEVIGGLFIDREDENGSL